MDRIVETVGRKNNCQDLRSYSFIKSTAEILDSQALSAACSDGKPWIEARPSSAWTTL